MLGADHQESYVPDAQSFGLHDDSRGVDKMLEGRNYHAGGLLMRLHDFRPYFGGQIVTANSPGAGNGTEIGKESSLYTTVDRGCKYYPSCLNCPFDYCIRHEKEFGIPNDRLAR